jgi:hypothetical protein
MGWGIADFFYLRSRRVSRFTWLAEVPEPTVSHLEQAGDMLFSLHPLFS